MNWKALFKVIGVAAAGAGLQTAVNAIPVVGNNMYGPFVTAGLIIGAAYGTKSPFVQAVLSTLQQVQPVQPKEEPKPEQK